MQGLNYWKYWKRPTEKCSKSRPKDRRNMWIFNSLQTRILWTKAKIEWTISMKARFTLEKPAIFSQEVRLTYPQS
jgi:hypothetical protein